MCPSLCSSVLGSRRKLWRFRSCNSSTGDVAARAARWNFWTLFLELLSDSPSCGGYASVLDAFGRISLYFSSWSCRATLGSTVDTYFSSASGWLWKNFRFFYVDGLTRILRSFLLSLWPRSSSTTAVACLITSCLTPGFNLDAPTQSPHVFA